MNTVKHSFTDDEIEKLRPNEKVGIVACANMQNEPHISLLTSIMPIAPQKMTVGQFSVGLSKQFMRANRNISFVMISLDQKMWRGKAVWTHFEDSGPEYEIYNNMPMFRYNAYFGINRVHYLDLVETTEGTSLPMAHIVLSVLKTMAARGGAGTGITDEILPPLGVQIFNEMGSLKFLSYMNPQGFPELIPVIQCQASDSRRLVFAQGPYGRELAGVPEGSRVAVFAMTLKMEDILIRGRFSGFHRHRGVKLGIIDIDWVYNSLPPAHGQIYPKVDLKAVTNF